MCLAYSIQTASFSAVATREIALAREYDIAPIRNSSSIRVADIAALNERFTRYS